MNRSRLEWADFAWAPITGCMRECTACVPRKRAFCASIDVRHHITDPRCKGDKDARLFELEEPFSSGRNIIALPFGFFPTRHRYRDDNPGLIKVSRRFLVGHMGDMFGEWVPDKWIEEVFESCARYPYHRYMFITKTPWRYEALWRAGKLPVRSNYWYGTVLENSQDTAFNAHGVNSFALIEPVSGSFANPAGHTQLRNVSWVVLSAESGRAAINPQQSARSVAPRRTAGISGRAAAGECQHQRRISRVPLWTVPYMRPGKPYKGDVGADGTCGPYSAPAPVVRSQAVPGASRADMGRR